MVTGFDQGFKYSEILLLWNLAKHSDLPDASALYWSVSAMDRAIAQIITSNKDNQGEDEKKTQDFLTKLYNYRTNIQLNPKMQKGLKDTRRLSVGQDILVLMKARKGIFVSKIVSCGKDIVIALPFFKKSGTYVLTGQEWVGHTVNIYFRRKNDASYSFETTVLSSDLFSGQLVLHLAHTDKLVRTQARKSVRAKCKIRAQMYIIKNSISELSSIETEAGLKCILEDISEDGALIRIRGKGISNLLVKLQFFVGETFVVMGGFVRGVEYNEEKNQSLLHFECTQLEQTMKNAILGFVYNVMSPEEKENMDVEIFLDENENNENPIKADSNANATESTYQGVVKDEIID